MSYIEKTQIIEKINKITFNFVEEGSGRGSEEIKKEFTTLQLKQH